MSDSVGDDVDMSWLSFCLVAVSVLIYLHLMICIILTFRIWWLLNNGISFTDEVKITLNLVTVVKV